MVIKKNENGRSVYADRDYAEGDLVEACEVIVVPKGELSQKDILMFYVFVWATDDYAMALGNGSLYNHSYRPNMTWDEKGGQIVFRACRPIKTGDELTHNYNGEVNRKEQVFFLDSDRAKFARGEK